LGERWGCTLSPWEGECLLGRSIFGRQEVLLAEPETFMNLSGVAARRLARSFDLLPEDILVVCDDVDLPLGKVRLRGSGGGGGHRGLISVIEMLGSEEFARLRIGVGRPSEGVDTADYVLESFEEEEENIVARVVPRAADAVEAALRKPLEAVMSEFNGWLVEDGDARESGPGGC
jgi:PTH1 family peptidyl-tRNA hydrolase